MHKLLERQLRKATDPDGTVDYRRLCEMVSGAYDEVDARLRLHGHAIQVLQEELEDANRRFREEADARFTVVMDNVGEAVVIIDEVGIIESFNSAAERTFGYRAAEVLGTNVTMLMTAADAVHHDETLRTYLRTGEPHVIGIGREVVARRRNGEEFPIDLAVGEVVSGSHRRFIGVIRDISQHKLIERQLRESEGRFREIAGSASDWFWETDADYRLVFVSDRIASVLGVKPSAILGCSFFDIGLGEGDAALAETHRATIADHEPFRDVVFHVGPEEGTDAKTVRISGIPSFDNDGQFIGYRGVGVDITREVAAERRAGRAQRQLADAIDSLEDAIAVYDSEDRLVVFNKRYLSLHASLQVDIAPGRPFADILRESVGRGRLDTAGLPAEDWVARRLDHHRQASGQPDIIHTADGRWVLTREFRTWDGGVVSVRTDVTEMKLRESELDRLRRRYELILDSAGEGIIGLDCDGKVTFANRLAGTILHYQPDEMIGKCFHILTLPWEPASEEQPCTTVDSPVRAAYRDGVPLQVDNEIFCGGDGRNVPVDYFVAPIMENAAVSGAVVIFRDATLRLQYERTMVDHQRELERMVAERTADLTREVEIRSRTEVALRASRERLKGIADSLFEGVLVIDRIGQVMFANASARSLLGATAVAGDIEGHPLDGLLLLRESDGLVDFTNSPWRRVATEGITLRSDDAVFTTRDGVSTPVAYACSPLREDDAIRGAIISFRDIRSLKQAQREALQSSRLATVGQLAAGIAHEINTPIQYVGDNLRFIGTSVAKLVGLMDAARDCGGTRFEEAAAAVKLPFLVKELPMAVEESLDGVAQIARIVLSMKEFSHPGTSAKTMTDINRAIESTLTVSRNTWKHVAEVHKDLDQALPPVLCLAGEMNQVFLNLVVNAAHAIEDSGKPLPGTITISTRHIGSEVEICIGDSGSGISEEIRDRIFDPFFTTKDVGKGTGQGLAICRDVVVTKHGGSINVDGRPGEGALFSIRLPIGFSENCDENANQAPHSLC